MHIKKGQSYLAIAEAIEKWKGTEDKFQKIQYYSNQNAKILKKGTDLKKMIF